MRLLPDHVHIVIAIPPIYAVSQVIGYMKGKSAIRPDRTFGERKRNFFVQILGCEDTSRKLNPLRQKKRVAGTRHQRRWVPPRASVAARFLRKRGGRAREVRGR